MTAYTPIYNLPYVEASDLVASYPTVSQELAENVETAIAGSAGLSLIDEESFSAVSSVSLNNVFSATYENYRIVLTGTGSADPGLYVRLRASGTDATGSNYSRQLVNAGSTTVGGSRQDTTYWYPIPLYTSDDNCMSMDLCRPFKAARTIGTYVGNYGNSSTSFYTGSLNHTLTVSYDGITFYPSSGTMTGTIRVYGYKGA